MANTYFGITPKVFVMTPKSVFAFRPKQVFALLRYECSAWSEIRSCRLVCLRVSPEVANERRRKLNITMQKKGRTPSTELLILTDWILMGTNVPEQGLAAEMLRPFYSLRWQIELPFKQIKTVVCIHRSATSKENRLRCEIYGKLIMVVIIHRIHADRNIMLCNSNHKELSMEKLYKRIQQRAFIILNQLLQSIAKAVKYLQYEITSLTGDCRKSYQRSRSSTLQIIDGGLSPWQINNPTPCLS